VSVSITDNTLLPFCAEASTKSVADRHVSPPFPRRGKYPPVRSLSNGNATLVRGKNGQKCVRSIGGRTTDMDPLSQPDEKAAPRLLYQ